MNKYKKPVGNRTHIDVYDVCDIFAVDDQSGAIQHAVKKLLCNGERGYKPAIQDYREAIGSIQRKIELMERDNFGQQNMLEWPESERRIDAIAQNGNDGEHYDKWPSWATHKLTTGPEWQYDEDSIGKAAYAFLSEGEYCDESGDTFFVMGPKAWIVIEVRPA